MTSEAAAPSPSPADARRSHHLFAAVAVATFAIATAGALEIVGRATRVFVSPPAVVVTTSGRQTLAEWRSRNLRGRVVVHFGRFLHFVEEESPPTPAKRSASTSPASPGQADYRSYLRVASSLGIARELVYVTPPRTLAERVSALDLGREGLPAAIPARTIPRTLTARPERLGEPALVELSASWFDDPEPPDPLALIRQAGLQSDLLVIDLAEDAPDVSEGARRAASAVARALGADVSRVTP